MRRFQLLLFNTIQKEARSKTLIMISILTVVIILLMNSALTFISKEVLSQMGGGDGVAAESSATALIYIISKLTTFLAIIFGVNCLKSDAESNVAPLLMSFPISRFEYLLARILGSWFIVVVYYLLAVFLGQVLLSSSIGTFVGGAHLLGAMFFASLSNLFVIIVSAFLGLWIPKIFALIMTSFISATITGANFYFKDKLWAEMTENLEFFKVVGLFTYGFFPRIGNIDELSRSILMKSETTLIITSELIHFGVTLSLFFGFFYLLFRRREI